MKTALITAIALTVAAPAVADVSAQQFFALSNDSAAERIVRDTSIGNVAEAQAKFAMQNESAAEENIVLGDNTVTRGAAVEAKIFFSMFNDSAAEIK